jgi:hypothetical protein
LSSANACEKNEPLAVEYISLAQPGKLMVADDRYCVLLERGGKVQKIKCSVANCAYNENYQCNAKGIEVNALGDGLANSSDGTCCETFVPREY